MLIIDTEFIEVIKKLDKLKIVNRGTGAGGANTNKTGLSYEERTYLPKILNLENYVSFGKGKADKYYEYCYNSIKYKIFHKNGFCKYLKRYKIKDCVTNMIPDEAVINEKNNKIYIIEKKFQQGSGSVDEKIQTGHCKQEMYTVMYPDFKITYIYVLSDWFKQSKYNLVMEYLKKYDIPVLFGSDVNYLEKLFNIISTSSK